MFSNLEFFIIEAFRSFRRGALMSMVAIGTVVQVNLHLLVAKPNIYPNTVVCVASRAACKAGQGYIRTGAGIPGQGRVGQGTALHRTVQHAIAWSCA